MEIIRKNSRAKTQGPSAYFTGAVEVQQLLQTPDPARVAIASVTFEAGARTAWHTHPLGQTLVVAAGVGWVQRWGGAKEEIVAGDVVWFAPNEKHWHGATSSNTMTHLAIQERLDGSVVDWLEQVSDTEYHEQVSDTGYHER